MRRAGWIGALLLVGLVLALPAQAAQKAEKKCTENTQACLNKMVANLQTRGWVGIELDKVNGKLTVTQVEADSPAKRAGLREGDVLLALNGVAFEEANHDKLKAMKKQMSVGKSLTYTVSRKGHEKQVAVTLEQIPETVLARWVGNHMLEHATVEIAQY